MFVWIILAVVLIAAAGVMIGGNNEEEVMEKFCALECKRNFGYKFCC